MLDFSCGLRGDQIVHRHGQMPMLLDVTVSNVVTPDVANKIGKPLTGVNTKSREVEKSKKYQEVRRSISQSFFFRCIRIARLSRKTIFVALRQVDSTSS